MKRWGWEVSPLIRVHKAIDRLATQNIS
jgi:hypothetical protein